MHRQSIHTCLNFKDQEQIKEKKLFQPGPCGGQASLGSVIYKCIDVLVLKCSRQQKEKVALAFVGLNVMDIK